MLSNPNRDDVHATVDVPLAELPPRAMSTGIPQRLEVQHRYWITHRDREHILLPSSGDPDGALSLARWPSPPHAWSPQSLSIPSGSASRESSIPKIDSDDDLLQFSDDDKPILAPTSPQLPSPAWSTLPLLVPLVPSPRAARCPNTDSDDAVNDVSSFLLW